MNNIFCSSNPGKIIDALWVVLSNSEQLNKFDFSGDIIFLPSRRAVRSVEKMLVEKSGGAVLLPKLVALGEGADIEIQDENDIEKDEVVSNQERLIVLSKMIAAAYGWEIGESLPVARDLIKTMDYIENEKIPNSKSIINWSELVDEKYAVHFQKKAEFLNFAANVLPNIFPNKITSAQKRNQDIRNWTNVLDLKYKNNSRVIVCGSTASVPATSDLMAHIAGMNNGYIILPGKIIGGLSDNETKPDICNPYYSEYKFIEKIGARPNDVIVIDVGESNIDFFNDAFSNNQFFNFESPNTICRIDCARESQEAEVVAEITKSALLSNKSVLIVTPDAAGNQRLFEAIRSHDIIADFSGGISLSSSLIGRKILNHMDKNDDFNGTDLFDYIFSILDSNESEIGSAELLAKIQEISEIVFRNGIVLTQRDARTIISDALGGIQIRGQMVENSSVCVLGTIESRMQTADVVILTGLNEDRFPALGYENPWLPTSVAEKIGLPSPMRKVSLQALDFINLSVAKNVYWTRSKTSGGNQTIESRFLSRIAVKLKNRNINSNEILGIVKSYDNVPSNPLDSAPPAPPAFLAPIFVTRLEDLIHNPYLYYAKSILGLSKRPDAWQDRSAIEFGNLIHTTVEQRLKHPKNYEYDFVSEFNVRAKEILPKDSVLLRFWQKRFIGIAKIINQVLETIPENALSETIGEVVIQNRCVRAKADLIWVDNNTGYVMDIKTGAAPSKGQLQDGTMPQLPLEALMMKNGGFNLHGDIKQTEISFLQLKRGDTRMIKYDCDKTQEFIDSAISKTTAIFNQYGQNGAVYEYRETNDNKRRYQEYDDLARKE